MRKMMTAIFQQLAYVNLNNETAKDRLVGSFTKEDLKKYLKDITNESNQKNLRKISRNLYLTSPHYRKLINYYVTLYTLDYVVEGYGILPDENTDVDKYKKAYLKNVDYIEKMNIKDEFRKLKYSIWIDGVSYGFARPSKDGFYIQELNPDYCKVTFINPETGLLGYSFNFSIFDKTEELLDSYPNEFRQIYNRLKREKQSNKWARIESPNAICIKPTPYGYPPIPPLLGLFEGILDIADFKALNKTGEEIGNYKLLFQKIPMKDGKDAGKDEFLISEDFVQIFHNNIESNLPPQVGLLTSPMEVTAINFDRDTIDRNKVAQATSQYWNEAGVSELLFGSNANSSAALKFAITADESELSPIMQSIERWINEHLKATQKGSFKFRVRLLNTTFFNKKNYFEDMLKAAQYGMPVKSEILASLGHQPSSMYIGAFLENKVLQLHEKLIPLRSSHTQSDIAEAGREQMKEEDLTEAGLQTRDQDQNENRVE